MYLEELSNIYPTFKESSLKVMDDFFEYCIGIGLKIRMVEFGIIVYNPRISGINGNDILVLIWADGTWNGYKHKVSYGEIGTDGLISDYGMGSELKNDDIGYIRETVQRFKRFVKSEMVRYKEMQMELKKERLSRDFR